MTNSKTLLAAERQVAKTPGVEIHGNRLRIDFRLDGKRYKEKLDLPVTKDSVIAAQGLRARVLAAIKDGSFVYGEFFAKSKHARTVDVISGKRATFGHYANIWLKTKQNEVRQTTFKSYNSKLKFHILPQWELRMMDDIKVSELNDWRQDLRSGDNRSAKPLSAKMIKEIFAIMNTLFEAAVIDGTLAVNPVKAMTKVKVNKTSHADPLTQEEITLLENTAPQRGRESEKNMIMFNCWMGLRISELIALAWEDVDLQRNCITVRRGLNNALWAATKEEVSTRVIPITPEARPWLERQRALSALLPPIQVEVTQLDNIEVEVETIRPVWTNSRTQRHHDSSFNVNQRFLKAFMKKAGVRYRPVKHLRHTFASQMITHSQATPEQIAAHMGHSGTNTMKTHYARELNAEKNFFDNPFDVARVGRK